MAVVSPCREAFGSFRVTDAIPLAQRGGKSLDGGGAVGEVERAHRFANGGANCPEWVGVPPLTLGATCHEISCVEGRGQA